MLHRDDAEGLVLIAQPAHAWISGQMARAWGGERFGVPAPWTEVCAAAEQHDIAWLAWEAAPRLNPESGLPYSFLNMPTSMHLSVWEPAGRLALSYGRYAALLVSMHGTHLYERFHDYARDTAEEAAMARTFLEEGKRFQQEMVRTLRDDPAYRGQASDEAIQRNRQLVSLWDGMSLALCLGIDGQRQFENVPDAGGSTTLTLQRDSDSPQSFTLDPWPFRRDSLTVACDGRRLAGRFEDEAGMRDAINAAPWVRLEFRLRPA